MSAPYPTAVRGPDPNSFFCAPYPGEPEKPSPQTRSTSPRRFHVGSKRDVRVEYPPTHILSREPTTRTALAVPAAPAAPVRLPQSNGQTSMGGAENSYEGHRPRLLDGPREFRLTWPMVIEFAFYFGSFSFMHYNIYNFWSKWSFRFYLTLFIFRVIIPVVIEYRHSIWRAFKYFVVDLIVLVAGPFLSIIELLVLGLLSGVKKTIAFSLLVYQYLAELLVPLTVWVLTPMLDVCFQISNSVSAMVGTSSFWLYGAGVALTVSWVMEALIEIDNIEVSHIRKSGVEGFAEVNIS